MPQTTDPYLKILHTVAETVSRSLDVEEVLATALSVLTRVTGHELSSLHLISPDGATLYLRGDRGLSPRLREVNRVLPYGEGVIGRTAATGETFCVHDASNDPLTFEKAREVVQADGIRGFVCVPIHSRGRILGTLAMGRRTENPFDEAEVALIEATAGQIGVALDNARLHSETVRQLDELKRMHAQLIHSEKLSAVGQLASGVAHEISNPLTAVLGQLHLLFEDRDLASRTRERLTIVGAEVSRAVRIMRNLLLFARQYPPERRPCSLVEQVRCVLDLKRHQLEQDRVRLVTDFASTGPVWADDNQLRQVLLNLVQNAHQAMMKHPGERVLTVQIGVRAPVAVVEVLDTGPGIAPDVLPRVFDPFFTTKPAGEGSGLGLSVSYGIVTEHGGTLRAENRPDGGARFVLELPLEKPAKD